MFLALAGLLNVVTTLLSFLLLGLGIWLGIYWYMGIFVGTQYIIVSLALLAFSFLGKYFVMFILRLVTRNESELKSQYLGEESTLTCNDGTELYVKNNRTPNGKTLILVHGWGLDHKIWGYLYETFKNKLSIVAFDLAGQGKSARRKSLDYSLEKYAEDLKFIIDREQNPVILTGHSIGGMIILTFCKQYPEYLKQKVKKIVLVHTTYTDPTKTVISANFIHTLKKPILVPLNYLTIALSPIIKVMNWLSYRNGMIHLATHIAGFGGKETAQQLDFIARYQYTSSPAVNSRGLNGMFRYDATNTLPQISIPVLMITGDHDKLTKKDAGEYIKKHIPNAQIAELRHAGHMGFLERNQEFMEVFEPFID